MVKMTSIDALHNDPVANETTDSEEFSLLTIPSVSPEPETASYDIRNLQTTLMVSSPDLSIDDVQVHLLDMLKENENLKVLLKINNTMVQEQLSMISSWEDQISQAKTKEESTLEEANKIALQYQKENEELTSKITVLTLQLQDSLKGSKVTPSCSKCENSIIEKSEFDSKLNQQKEIQKQLESNISSMTLQLEQLENENKLLLRQRQELTSFNYALQTQLSINCPESLSAEDFGYTVISNPDKEKTERISKESIASLYENIADLRKQLKEKDNEVRSLKNRTTQLEQELAQSEESIKNSLNVLDEEFKNKSALEQEHSACVQKVEHAKAKLENMQHYYKSNIKELEEEVKSTNELIQSIKKNLEKAQMEKNLSDEKLKKLESLHAAAHVSESTKIKQLTLELDTVSVKVVQLEQELRKKEHKVRLLLSELASLKSDSDSVPIFRAQAEVYQSDFENEKRAKEDAQIMIEALERKVILLEDQISELQLALNKCSRDHGNSAAEAPVVPSKPFACPCCFLQFTDIDAAEKHANMCADSLPAQM